MTSVADVQAAVDRTYPGLQLFARDVNLAPELARKYVPGLVIRERGFTDATPRLGGMVTTHRFVIMSSHMVDVDAVLSQQGQTPDATAPNWRLHIAQRDSHFKVLGRHGFNGRTLIFLLHLPDDDAWRVLANVSISLDDQALADSIARMEKRTLEPPIPEVTSEQWLDRCRFPLGMSDAGQLFPLED